MLKLGRIIELNSGSSKRADAAIYDGAHTVTWGEYESWVRRLVKHFAGKKHRRVVFLSDNRWELVPMFGAFSTLGASFIGIDYTSGMTQKHHCVKEVEATCIVYSEKYRQDVEQIRQQAAIEAFSLDTDLPQLAPDDGVEPQLPPSPPFESISFTSGTTGLPKGVYRTKPFDTKRFADLTKMFGFDSSQVFLATIPFYHVSVTGWARMFLNLGGKLVLSDVSSAEVMVKDLMKRGCTSVLATPAVLQALMDELVQWNVRPKVNFVLTGGKVFPMDLKRKTIEYFGKCVTEYYGTTETGVNAIATSDDMLTHPTSAGRLMDGNKIAIIDANGNPLPEGQLGRVAILSYQNMQGYLNGKKADTVVVGGDTYVVTADVGYLQGDRIYLANRAFGNTTKFDLYTLENNLRQLPGVRDVFSIAVSAQKVGIFIAKQKNLGHEHLESQALPLIRNSLVGSEFDLKFVEKIPYSMSGKVRIEELIKLA